MDYIPTPVKQRALDLLTIITTSSQQTGLDPVYVGIIILSISLAAISILMWILSYARILIILGLMLGVGNISLRYVKAEWPAWVPGDSAAAARVKGEGRKMVEGLEGLEEEMRAMIEAEEEKKKEEEAR